MLEISWLGQADPSNANAAARASRVDKSRLRMLIARFGEQSASKGKEETAVAIDKRRE
jgi:hypothetical protein